MCRIALLISLLVVPLTVSAQPATYSDGVLTIPGVVITDNDTPAYYTDVELALTASGLLGVVQANEANLVTVESVEVQLLESMPVQVQVLVSGFKSVPCVDLLEPGVDVQGNTFQIVLAETVLGPAESCIAVTDPFETLVALPVNGLSAGDYIVTVNGMESGFTLEADNLP